MQRIPSFKTLDAFRGFAALWVVMRHSCDRWLGDGNIGYASNPIYAFAVHGQIGVTLFFLISGYCVTAAAYGSLTSGKTVSRFGYERIRRIYPPYLAALLLATLSLIAIHFANDHRIIPAIHHLQSLPASPFYWLANIFLIQKEFHVGTVDVVYWSLCYEVAFYLFVAIFLAGAKWIAERRGLAPATQFFVTAFGISSALTVAWLLGGGREIFPFDQWHQFSVGSLLFFLLELKASTFAHYSRSFARIVQANAAIVGLLVILYVLHPSVENNAFGNPSSAVRSLVALLFAFSLYGLRKIDNQVAMHPVVRPFMLIGSFSYGLYLVHNIFLPYIDVLSRKFGLNHSLYMIAFFLQIGISLLIGRLFYLTIERHFISRRQVQRHAAEHLK